MFKLKFILLILIVFSISVLPQFEGYEFGIPPKDTLQEITCIEPLESGLRGFSFLKSSKTYEKLPSSVGSEKLSRNGLLCLSRFSAVSPTVSINGEEIYLTHYGSIDLGNLPIDLSERASQYSSAFSLANGADLFTTSLDFKLVDSLIFKDYTRLSAHWGVNSRQSLGGVFYKKIGKIGWIGLSGSEFKSKDHFFDGDSKIRDYSPIAFIRYRNFDLFASASRIERWENIKSPGGEFAASSSRLESDNRNLSAKLGYNSSNARLELNFNHQDELRVYSENRNIEGLEFDNSFNIDGVGLGIKYSGLRSIDLALKLRSRGIVLERDTAFSAVWRDYNSLAQAEIAFSKSLTAILALRSERDIFEQMNQSPIIGLRLGSRNSSLTVLGFYSTSQAPLKFFIRPFESDLYTLNGDNPDTVVFQRDGLRESRPTKTKGADLKWDYCLGNGLSIVAASSYIESTNPTIYGFSVDSTEQTTKVNWAPRDFEEIFIAIPLQAGLSYRPDSLFEISCDYNFNFFSSGEEVSLSSIPRHRILAFVQEGRRYLDDLAKLSLRLEGEALIDMPDFAGRGQNPMAILRAETRFDYLSFSLFAFGEYCLAKTPEGWKNHEILLDPFINGTYLTKIPSWSIRGGLEWFFLD